MADCSDKWKDMMDAEKEMDNSCAEIDLYTPILIWGMDEHLDNALNCADDGGLNVICAAKDVFYEVVKDLAKKALNQAEIDFDKAVLDYQKAEYEWDKCICQKYKSTTP